MLPPLVKLNRLYLDNNEIAEIDSNSFLGLKSLEYLTLQNNFISLDDGFIVRASPFQMLLQLKELNLANNSFTAPIEDYTLERLTLLNMSYNLLTDLSTDKLDYLTRSKLTLDFSNNRITEFEYKQEGDQDLPETTLILNNNPINCDCKIIDFVQHLKNRGSMEKKPAYNILIGDLKCVNPENLKNRAILDLKLKELVCPLDMPGTTKPKCPNECQCMLRSIDRHLLLECESNVNFDALPSASNITYKHTELKIENKNLTHLPSEQSLGFRDITHLLVSGNQISQITVENLPPNLKVLELHDNKLTTLNESVMNFIINSSVSRLTLKGNPWKCDCENIDFINFAQKLNLKIEDYSEIKCGDSSLNILNSGNLCKDKTTFIVVICIFIAIMGLLLGALAALYYKYQKQIKMWLYSHNILLWLVTEEELDKVCKLLEFFFSFFI